MNTLPKLQIIFNEIQTCDAKRFSDNLKEILKLIPLDNSFLTILDTLLLFDKAIIPSKILHFIKNILEEQCKTNKNIFISILQYLYDKIDCKATKVRRNTIKFIALMISIDQSCLNSELVEKVAERLFDKEQSVRKEALKFCIPFQKQTLSSSITIKKTIKDMIRYDQSHEIRKIAFLNLELDSETLNCILERVIDSNLQIRKAFWLQYFNNIDLKLLDHAQRIYLMKNGINEREFDAKSIFLQKIKELGLPEFIEYFYSETEEYDSCIIELIKDATDEYSLNDYTPSYLKFLCTYYKIKEDADGKDSLKLIELNEFLEIFYFKCKQTDEIPEHNVKQLETNFKVLKYLLRILSFYDLFTEESKKYVFSIINFLIYQQKFNILVEEYIVLGIRISGDRTINFIGSLIKKTKNQPVCYLICEFAMKHLPFSELFDGILCEIVILNIEASFNIFYWYLMKNYKETVEKQYLNFLPIKEVINGCTDLVLNNLMSIEKIELCLFNQITKFNTSTVIPICKLLLAKKTTNSEFIKHLLIIFYSTENESIQQYLALFFYEYFRLYPESLIEVFCSVLELINSNHKIFLDQSIYWISENALQSLFFNICIYLINNYDVIINRKYLFSMLFRINVAETWDKVITKKIIYLLGVILRKRPRENINLLLSSLVEIDDGVLLSEKEFNELEKLLSTK